MTHEHHNHDDHDHDSHNHKGGWRGTLSHIRGHSHEITVDSWIKVVKILVAMALNGWLGIWQIARLSREANSAGILVDGIHNASDMFSLSVPLITVGLTIAATLRHKKDESFLPTALTFINFVALAVFMIAAIPLAIWRLFIAPVESSGAIMGKAGMVSLAVNIVSVLLLHEREEERKDKSMRSAMMHQVSDLLSSIAVIAGSLAVTATGLRSVDPILTIGISVFILWMITDDIREEGSAVLEWIRTRYKKKLA